MIWKVFYGLFVSVFVGSLISCASLFPPPPPVTKIWYEMDPSTPSSQTKNDVTVVADYIRLDNVKNYPEFVITKDSLPNELRIKWAGEYGIETKSQAIYPFVEKTAFYVQVTNNTSRILRLGDARIFLIVGEETYSAMTREEAIASIMGIRALATEPLELQREMISRVLSKAKFINDLSTEILPHFSAKGFIVFDFKSQHRIQGSELRPDIPVRIPPMKPARLAFFDIITKVSEAGVAIEKTNFEFNLIPKKETIMPGQK